MDHCPDVPAKKPGVAGTRTILESIRGGAAWRGDVDALSMALAVRPITESQARQHVAAAINSHNRVFPVESQLWWFSMLLDSQPRLVEREEFCPLHKPGHKERVEGRVEFARLFVEPGVDPNRLHPEHDETALEVAIENQRDELAEYLKVVCRK